MASNLVASDADAAPTRTARGRPRDPAGDGRTSKERRRVEEDARGGAREGVAVDGSAHDMPTM